MKSSAFAAAAAAAISSRVASGRPYAMLSAIVRGKMKGSWSTIATCCRSDRIRRVRRSWPSMRTRPLHGSKNRTSRFTRVVFPAPVGPTIATTSPGRASSDTSVQTGRPDA